MVYGPWTVVVVLGEQSFEIKNRSLRTGTRNFKIQDEDISVLTAKIIKIWIVLDLREGKK